MAAPATTGQLKTNLADMVIGDYIVCNYQAASGAVGTFSNMGGAAGTEIPIPAPAAPNGSFYFVKLFKGLLCSDRVIQTSISWDVLNSAKVAQGFPFVLSKYPGIIVYQKVAANNPLPTTDEFRALTTSSAWQGSNVIIARDEYSITATGIVEIEYDAFLTGFYSSAPNHSLSLVTESGSYNSGRETSYGFYQYETAPVWSTYHASQPTLNVWHHFKHVINFTARTHTAYVDGAVANPTSAKFNTVTSGQKLFIQIGVGSYNYAASNRYKNITVKNASDISSKRVKFGDMGGVIRSLTGGVAYADANGNSSMGNANNGAWPTNNEWDKYIVNFPTDKIQTGQTLDDVFHWDGLFSWAQDTPVNGLFPGDVANRAARGNYGTQGMNEKGFKYGAAATGYTTGGFRPAFEFSE